MDSTGTPRQQLIDESRMELAIAASNAERANRPRHFTAAAMLLLICAIGYLAWGYSARASMLGEVEQARARARTTIGLVEQYRAATGASGEKSYEPDPYMAAHIENLALEQLIEQSITVTATDAPAGAVQGMAQRRYSVTISNADLQKILAWLISTQTSPDTKGLEIQQLQLRPGAPLAATGQVGWTVTADFVRWERK